MNILYSGDNSDKVLLIENLNELSRDDQSKFTKIILDFKKDIPCQKIKIFLSHRNTNNGSDLDNHGGELRPESFSKMLGF